MTTKKKEFPKPIKQIEIPIYGGLVYIFIDRMSFCDAADYLNIKDVKIRVCGQCITKVDRDTGAVHYLVGVFNNEIPTLVHELAHVTADCLAIAGIAVDNTNNEAFCYLLDYLLTMCDLDNVKAFYTIKK